MAEIKAIINNYGKFCGNCHFQERGIGGWYCKCYRNKYLQNNPDGSFSRLTECIAGEGELAALREAEKENQIWNEGANCNTCPLSKWEACDEICRSMASLIKKIAELAAEAEHRDSDAEKWDQGYGEDELKAVIKHLAAVLEDEWDRRAVKTGEQPDFDFEGIYRKACAITGRERKYFTQDYPFIKAAEKIK
ncbi:MAG: hypothetical protein LBQ89_08085 [Treponema sp.]|jgi:hypothetical protein|nr:hypothetical protein [Treponema sp.]